MQYLKNRTKVFFTILLFFITLIGCENYSHNDKRTTNKNKISTRSEPNNIKVDKTLQFSDYAAYSAFIIGIITFGLFIMRERKNSFRISELKNSIKKLEGVLNLQKTKNRETIASLPYKGNDMSEKFIEKIIEKKIPSIADHIMHCIELNKIEQEEMVTVKQTPINLHSVPIEYNSYARTVNSENDEFYKVTDNFESGKSIYTLIIDGNNAKFKVAKEVYGKVLKETNFLESACEIQKIGNQKNTIVTKEAGIAERQLNGNWRIVKKTIIIIE